MEGDRESTLLHPKQGQKSSLLHAQLFPKAGVSTLFEKGQMISIFSFASHLVIAATIQLCFVAQKPP